MSNQYKNDGTTNKKEKSVVEKEDQSSFDIQQLAISKLEKEIKNLEARIGNLNSRIKLLEQKNKNDANKKGSFY